MTWILRKIDDADPWVHAFGAEPTLAVLRDLMPSPKDGGSISVFEVRSPAVEALRVAGAFAMQRQKMEGQVQFVGAKTAAFTAAGLSIVKTPGTLNHKYADPRHRDLVLPDQKAWVAAATCFLAGDLFPFAGKSVIESARRDMRLGQFDCAAIGRRGFAESAPAGKNLMKFLGEKVAVVRGVRL